MRMAWAEMMWWRVGKAGLVGKGALQGNWKATLDMNRAEDVVELIKWIN
jgi:hypothetical protein